MPIVRTRRRRGTLSMTSLIDVIFLLLLFFMLTSTFVRHQQVEILAPNAQGASGGAAPDVLIRAETDNRITINGEAVALPDLVRHLAVLRQAGGEALLVKASAGAASQTLISAVEAARRSGFERISVAD